MFCARRQVTAISRSIWRVRIAKSPSFGAQTGHYKMVVHVMAERSRQPLVFMHRGYRRWALENSTQAFVDAVEASHAGIELGIEFDVRFTGDNVPVILHDESFFGVLLADVTYRELRARFASNCPPLLADAVEILGEGNFKCVNAEIKEYGGTAQVLEILQPIGEQLLVVSTDRLDVAKQLQETARHLQRGLVFHDHSHRVEDVDKFMSLAEEYEADILVVEHTLLSPALIERLHSVGKRIGTYTINDVSVFRRMHLAGDVDCIYTDVTETFYSELDHVGSSSVS